MGNVNKRCHPHRPFLFCHLVSISVHTNFLANSEQLVRLWTAVWQTFFLSVFDWVFQFIIIIIYARLAIWGTAVWMWRTGAGGRKENGSVASSVHSPLLPALTSFPVGALFPSQTISSPPPPSWGGGEGSHLNYSFFPSFFLLLPLYFFVVLLFSDTDSLRPYGRAILSRWKTFLLCLVYINCLFGKMAIN